MGSCKQANIEDTLQNIIINEQKHVCANILLCTHGGPMFATVSSSNNKREASLHPIQIKH